MYRRTVVALCIFLCQTALSGGSSFRMAPLFTDSMVVQQRSTVALWGNGDVEVLPITTVGRRIRWRSAVAG